MSNQENNKNNEDKQQQRSGPNSPRSPGSSPFASPRSDVSSSPRFEQFIKGMRIPASNTPTANNSDQFIAGICCNETKILLLILFFLIS
jgi:hypothetical protein